jgi:uncharacterized Zn finger protein
MVRIPEIKESDIQQWVGTAAFQRGYRYYEDEAILNPRRRGSRLISECQGTHPEPYRVEIQLGPEEIALGSCTCPAGDGGHCKHAAALLLMWVHESQMFTEVPDLDVLLENHSKAELITLVQQMVARYPELEQLIELSALRSLSSDEKIQSDLIAQQIRRAFSSAGGENGDNARIAENLQPILDLAEDLADREDVRNAATVYETLLEGILSYEDCLYHDEGGDLGQVLAECEQGIQSCLENTRDPVLRQSLLHCLFDFYIWDLQAGALGFGDETPAILLAVATPDEKKQIAEWIQNELPDGSDWSEDYQRRTMGGLWLALLGGQIEDDDYLRICRDTGRSYDLIDRLLSLGRVDDALAAAREYGGSNNITAIADLFELHGYPNLGYEIVKGWPNSEAEAHLLEWLRLYAIRQHQPEEALRLAELLFWQSQTLENYHALIEAAATLNKREEVRRRVIQRLENAGNFSLLVEIQLLENNVDLALASLDRVNPDIWLERLSMLRRQVAKAVENPYPQEAARQYLILAEELIQQHNRSSYAEAARMLQQVRSLYHDLGENERWENMISTLRQGHRRLPDLIDEFHRAGL